MHHAAENGHQEIVKLLLEKGAKVNKQEKLFGKTALHYAKSNKNDAIIKLLKKESKKERIKEERQKKIYRNLKVTLVASFGISSIVVMSRFQLEWEHLLAASTPVILLCTYAIYKLTATPSNDMAKIPGNDMANVQVKSQNNVQIA